MTRRNRKPMGKRKGAAAIRFTLAGRSAIPPAARKTRARFPAGGVRVLEFAICGPRRGGGGSDPSSEGRELGPALPSRRSPREQIPGPSRRASWSAPSWRENIPNVAISQSISNCGEGAIIWPAVATSVAKSSRAASSSPTGVQIGGQAARGGRGRLAAPLLRARWY